MGGVCHIGGQQRYIWVWSNMGLVLSLMGSEKIRLGFVKYGLDFVTYGVKKDSVQFCHIWLGFVMGFVIYGQYSAATTFYEQWEVRLG